MRCVVTGGSKGLGLACVEEMLQLGASVLLTARGADDLQQVQAELSKAHAGRVHILAADVSEPAGREALVATDGGVEWIRHRALARDDRVAHRYAVGALAVLAAHSLRVAPHGENNRRGRLDPWSLRLAMEATVKAGLESGDSQAACFACGMLRRVAREGDEPTRRFAASLGATAALLRLLGSSSVASGGVSGWAAEEEVAGAPDASAAGRIRRRQRKGDDGARACALRALEAFALVRPPTNALRWSVLKAKNGLAVLAETADGTNGESASVRKLASDVLAALGK